MTPTSQRSEGATAPPQPGHGRLVLVPNTLDHGNEPTPIEQVLPLSVLQHAARLGHWLAEDARSARAFLKRVSAVVPLDLALQAISVTEMPRPRKGSREGVDMREWDALLEPARAGRDLGLLSEAGLPAVADPGAAAVAAAHAAGIDVMVLPGPSSLLLALAASGLNGQSFAFVGYLPQDADERHRRIRELDTLSRRDRQTQIAIETPYRNSALAQALIATLGPGTRLSISVGLTLPDAWTRCQSIERWRRSPPSLPDKVPAVFCWLAG